MTSSALWKALFGRRTRLAEDGERELVLTPANGLTVFRAVLSTAIIVFATIEQSHELLLVGLGISMLLDFCDGHIARGGKRETVLGAQLDSLADRMATALVAAGVVSIDPSASVVVAAVVVWIQFGVVDYFFATQFLRFDLWSPDHFHELGSAGERVWRHNWSAPAKLASNLAIVLLALGWWWAALLLSTVLIAFRLPEYKVIKALAERLPERRGKRRDEADGQRSRKQHKGRSRPAHRLRP